MRAILLVERSVKFLDALQQRQRNACVSVGIGRLHLRRRRRHRRRSEASTGPVCTYICI